MNIAPTIIGLTGYKGAGKTTVADILVDRHGFTRVSFGTALKDMIKRIDPVLGSEDGQLLHLSDIAHGDIDERQLKERFPEYRRFMQYLGTEGIRKVDGDFWVRALHNTMWKKFHEGHRRFVIDDCRFPNEASFILQNRDARLWLVEGRIGKTSDHASESHVGSLGETDTIDNGGDYDTLVNIVDQKIAVDHQNLHHA